jgi:hypothetical protein
MNILQGTDGHEENLRQTLIETEGGNKRTIKSCLRIGAVSELGEGRKRVGWKGAGWRGAGGWRGVGLGAGGRRGVLYQQDSQEHNNIRPLPQMSLTTESFLFTAWSLEGRVSRELCRIASTFQSICSSF